MRMVRFFVLALAVFVVASGSAVTAAVKAAPKPPSDAKKKPEKAVEDAKKKETPKPKEKKAAPQAPAVPPQLGTEWLAGHVNDVEVVVVDARPNQKEYLKRHVPGAQPLTLDNLRSVSGGIPGQIYPEDVLREIHGRLGLTEESHVIVYAEDPPDAAFVAAVLRISGVPKVSVLDGGWKTWEEEERASDRDLPLVKTSRPRFSADYGSAIATLDDVQKAVEKGGALLLDVRDDGEYSDGHIPGAVWRPWQKDYSDRRFRGVEEIRKDYEKIGIRADRPVIVYCNSGHQAAATFYNLRYRLGYEDVKLYDGSWLEWDNTPGLRKERGRPRGATGADEKTESGAPREEAKPARTEEAAAPPPADAKKGKSEEPVQETPKDKKTPPKKRGRR